MSFPATVYNVMIASPGDVAAEREIAHRVLWQWNYLHSHMRKIILLPVGWENSSAPLMEKTASGATTGQSVINKQVLEKSDFLIGIFWNRIGTRTTDAISGTVEEIQKHVNSGKPASLYFSTAPVARRKVDQQQAKKLENFQRECQKQSYYNEYESIEQFEKLLSNHIQLHLNTHPLFNQSHEVIGKLLVDSQKADLSEKAKLLLMETSEDSDGTFIAYRVLAGFFVDTNGKNLFKEKNARLEAQWLEAISQLKRLDLAIEVDMEGQTHKLTHKGFKLADELKSKR